MGWNHIQDFTIGATGNGTSVDTAPSPGANVLYNWITAHVWGTKSFTPSDITVTDNAAVPNAYTQLGFTYSAIQSPTIWCSLFIGQILSLPNAGNIVLTAKTTIASSKIMACGSEWGGGRGSSVVESSSSQKDLTGNPFAGNMTTQTLDALILAVCVSQDGNSPGTITVPANFTTVSSELFGAAFAMGNGCYRVTSGINVLQSKAWTFDNGAFAEAYAALQVALSLQSLPPVPASKGINAEGGE
jgi:hypothetical protein